MTALVNETDQSFAAVRDRVKRRHGANWRVKAMQDRDQQFFAVHPSVDVYARPENRGDPFVTTRDEEDRRSIQCPDGIALALVYRLHEASPAQAMYVPLFIDDTDGGFSGRQTFRSPSALDDEFLFDPTPYPLPGS